MLRLVHRGVSAHRKLVESGAAESLIARITEGREPATDDLQLLEDYVAGWEDIRNFAIKYSLDAELGIRTLSASLNDLSEAVVGAMSSEDAQVTWVDHLRSVITGCAECFKQVMLLGYPPIFDGDLQTIDDSAAHIDRIQDWLKEASETYIEMVRLFEEGTTYDACGDSLTRIEEYLGLPASIEHIFAPLCDSFRKTKVPVADLQASLNTMRAGGDNHVPNPEKESHDRETDQVDPEGIVEDDGEPSTETAAVQEEGKSGAGSTIAPVHHDDPDIEEPANLTWVPPTKGMIERTTRVENESQHHTPRLEDAATNRPDDTEIIMTGSERYYERGVDTGSVGDLMRICSFGGALAYEPPAANRTAIDAFAYGTAVRTVGGLLDIVEGALSDEVRTGNVFRIFLAFDEPSPDATDGDLLMRYYLLRTVAERLGVAGGEGSVEDLEYYLSVLIDICEKRPSMDESTIITICEAALRLCLTLSDSCFELATRALSLGGTRCADAQMTITKTRRALRGSYLSPEQLVRQIRKMQGRQELDEIRAYAAALGPDAYNDKYSGATQLWKWLVSQNCDVRFKRVQDMIRTMRGEAETFEPSWAFTDDDDISDYIDASFSAQNVAAGRPNERIVGSPKKKLLRYLSEISRTFERFCEVTDPGTSSYVNPLYKQCASDLLAVHSLLTDMANPLSGHICGRIANRLLSIFPEDALPWEAAASFDPDDRPSATGTTEVAFIELQAHRPALARIDWERGDVLPSEAQLVDTMQNGLKAYVINAIDFSQREELRHTLAGILGVRKRVSKGVAISQYEARCAYWAFECLNLQLRHAMEETFQRLRSTVEKQLADATKPDDSRRRSLEEMLLKMDEDSSLEEVLSYGDFLVEANVAIPEPPKPAPDDILYGTDDTEGVYSLIRQDLSAQGGFFPSSRVQGIPSDIRSSDIQPARDSITRLTNLVDRSPIPVNGESKPYDNARTRDAARQFCDVSKKLFAAVGFASVTVSPLPHNGTFSRFAVDFASIPGSLLADGSPVSPLAQLTSMHVGPLDARGANARLFLEAYTSFESLITAIANRDMEAGSRRIALYLGQRSSDVDDRRMLTLQDRVRLARAASSSDEGSGFLLLDRVLLAFLLHYDLSGDNMGNSDRLGAFFRCASQFTNLHPYVDRGIPSDERRRPAKGKSVPLDQPPLFYGRSQAIDRIKSFKDGSAEIVYGARRMGKTSILREVEAILSAKRSIRIGGGTPADSDAYTIPAYCDLRGHTGGSVDDFWTSYLAPAFDDSAPGQIDGLSHARNASEVQKAMREFIDGTGYRLLALLDEADDMVHYDSYIIEERNEHTSILDSLYAFRKEVPSFRFVLCGLHSTMRYSGTVPNRVSGHMGRPIEVAPLWEEGGYLEAYRLVYEPLKAMGIRLEHQSVLNIIRRAGYYPNLINQICEALLDKVRQRRDLWTLERGPYVSVPNYLVEAVFNDFDEMLQRNFLDTIAVDHVYGTIVYSIAVLGTREGWGPVGIADILATINEACRDEGLSSSPKDLEIYLRELVVFRVVRNEGRRYTLRDPELRSLLESLGEQGAADRLRNAVREWDESNQELYHPELARDVLSWLPNGTCELSPLNHQQVAQVETFLESEGLCVISGSNEVGLGRLVLIMQHSPERVLPSMRGWDIRLASAESALGDDSAGEPHGNHALWMIIDGWNIGDVALAKAKSDSSNRFLFIAGPEQLWSLISRGEHLGPAAIHLTPWEPNNLRQWLRRAVGDHANQIYESVSALTGNLPALVFGHEASNLLATTPVEDIDGLETTDGVTYDLRNVLDNNPPIEEIAHAICEQGPRSSFTIEEWGELLECEDDDFLAIVRWLVSMEFLSSEEGIPADALSADSAIRPREWASRFFNKDGSQ